jgi:methylsterol monooxygenase
MTAFTFSLTLVLMLLAINLFGLLYSLTLLYTPWLNAYKIQPKPYPKGVFLKRMPLYGLNFSILLTFAGVGSYFIFPYLSPEIPPLLPLAIQVIIAFVFDDVFFYFYHRWLHVNKTMLGKVHFIHHRANPPFPLEYLYNHPLEWMLGMIGAVFGCAMAGLFFPLSTFTIICFGAIRNLHEIHIHSDVTLPFISKIPLISKTKHHDDHHSMLEGNYASTFVWWDKLFKTELKNDSKN